VDVGHWDGVTPTLVAYLKNRVGNGAFNLMETAWTFTGSALNLRWEWLRGNQNAADGHNSRAVDVDGDGIDEVGEIGFLPNGNGTLRQDDPSGTRLSTLAHNPLYRTCMTFKGNLQSHHVDYFLGAGMSTPPAPHITYVPR